MERVEFERLFQARYGVAPKLEGLLLMIGMDVLGYWPQGDEKVVKQDLIALGAWRLLEWKGYAVRQGVDAEGWPQYDLTAPLPYQTAEKENEFLEEAAMAYFTEIWRNLGDACP
jgi:hypothetical protein